MKTYIRIMVALLAVAGILCGCSQESMKEGVIATVNGKPILMSQLEARYDLNNLSWSGGLVPAVDALRSDYGNVLTQLIVNELVNQALERAGLGVKDEAVAQAESVIRADYPEGQFEKSLVEEYIDITVWRSQLRQQLAMETLKTDILRPRIKLTSQEAEAYYKEHVADFYLPPRMRFYHISGVDKDRVSKARDMYAKSQNPEEIIKAYDDIAIRELRMRISMLPLGWKAILEKLKEGEVSPVFSGDNGYEALALLEHMPEKVLGPSRAYPLVEKILLEQKLQVVFDEWLQNELKTADIKISSLLLHPAEKDGAAETGDTAKEKAQ